MLHTANSTYPAMTQPSALFLPRRISRNPWYKIRAMVTAMSRYSAMTSTFR